MKFFIAKTLFLIPPIMLIVTFLSHLVELNYVFAGNLVGYSLLTSIPMIHIFWFTNKKYCLFTKLSSVALPIMNVVCIIGVFLSFEKYTYIFDLTIISITTLLTIVLTLKKRK